MRTHRLHSERGFTLIELLTVIAILGVLSALSLQGFTLYKASAGFSVAESLLRDARTSVAAAQSAANASLPIVPDQFQNTTGGIGDPDGRQFLPGLQVPKNVLVRFAHDPTCLDALCPFESRVEVKHCAGAKYARWIRFGDGAEVTLEIPGAGCAP